MKAVILAAGLSSRIRAVTNGAPKCLLQFGERTILDFQLDSLLQAGINQVAIVVGHGKQHIVNHVARRHAPRLGSITFVENPRFAVTNNIYSLWLAKQWVGESDFLCLNADVLFHPRIIAPAVVSRSPISVIVDPEFREETMKVMIRDGRVLTMQKGIPRGEASGTYIGITRFSRRICGPLFGAIQELIAEGRVKEFFNTAVVRLIGRGTPVSFTSTFGLPWAEVDDPADLLYAQSHTYPRLAWDLNRTEPVTSRNESPFSPVAEREPLCAESCQV